MKNTTGIAVGILLLTLMAYAPSIQGQFIWDDEAHVTETETLRTWQGLRAIWTQPGAVQQYYPLTYTLFWIQFHLWHPHVAGYHLVNIFLHAFNAILLMPLLIQLEVPGAWLAGLLFAIHPVHVESVAWISELKNTLSTFLYLLSLIAYLRFESSARRVSAKASSWRWYFISLLLYLSALFAKTVTASLPAAVCLLLWWKRGLQRQAILRLLPFFILGWILGLHTLWVEKTYAGAVGSDWALGAAQRFVVAGRALWFYAGKIVWPNPLMFIYPRWPLASLGGAAFFFPLSAAAVLTLLWVFRNRTGEAPFVAVAFFAGTLTPALGFFNLYPMRYSFVADHFQYLASLGLFSLVAAILARGFAWLKKRSSPLAIAALGLLIFNLGFATAQETLKYKNNESLWRDTLAKNGSCAIAHHNLAALLYARGDLHGALDSFRSAHRLNPDDPETNINLGQVLFRLRRSDEALPYFHDGLTRGIPDPKALNNYGVALMNAGRALEAIPPLERALRLLPGDRLIQNNLQRARALKKRRAGTPPRSRRAPEALHRFQLSYNSLTAYETGCDLSRVL